MTKARHRSRGQPLVALVTVLCLWTIFRAVLWQSPFPIQPLSPSIGSDLRAFVGSDESMPAIAARDAAAQGRKLALVRRDERGSGRGFALPSNRSVGSGSAALAHDLSAPFRNDALSRLQGRDAARAAPRPAGALVMDSERSFENRWSFDGWLLYRTGANRAPGGQPGALPPSYGASQAGAVLNLHLDRGSRHRPRAYLRLSHAFGGARESEGALGLSARVAPSLPVRAHLELRAQDVDGRTRLRPAAFAVTELPPVELTLGARGEAYLQAGYVGGEFDTAFVDGQLRISREIASFDLARIDAGVGAWGGAQQGAARLDIGPTVGIGLRLGEAPVRLSLDYRRRVAGAAQPPSGLAVTLSTGF